MRKTSDGGILLVLLPFWDPQIPPLGLAGIKGFLRQHDFQVRTIDANTEMEFRELYYTYHKTIKKYVPENKRGNLYNIGNEVLRNHMMAHLNQKNERDYIELVKILVYKTFYCDFDDSRVYELNEIMSQFYVRLENYVSQLLEKEKPGLLGLSVYSGTLPASLFTFRYTRERYPHIKTVMGGGIFADQLAPGSYNLEFFKEKTHSYIDKIIVGEGEMLFLKLLKGELQESQRIFSIDDINRETIALDTVSIPDYSDFDLSSYPHLAAYGSRSCPFQCSFCSETVNWGPYRKKKVRQLVEELIHLNNRHAYQLFMLTDSLLNPIVTDLANEILNRGASIYWDGFLRADQPVCDIENTLLWRRGGFYRAKLGLESGSPRVLEIMGKKITIKQVEEAISSLAYAGIKTTTFWVIGHPGETGEDFQLTLDLVEKLKDKIYEADCNPFYYYPLGQVNSSHWMEQNQRVLLYPEKAKHLLISQTWRLDMEPSREETYKRLNRFIAHCKELGVPNPYCLEDISQADDRWKKLHPNAVPPLLELRDKRNSINESKHVKKLSFARTLLPDDDDWL